MSRYSKYGVQPEKSSKKLNIWVIISVVFFVVLIAAFIVDENRPTNEYLKDLVVTKASIAEFATENGKFYVRLNISNTERPIYMNSDDSWFEVASDFYSLDKMWSEVGVLVGNYDVFKKKFWSNGQKFEKSVWVIEDVYKSYEAAQTANPAKKYTQNTVLKKKKTTSKGDTFFVLEAEQRTFTMAVKKDVYDKYKENQKVECEFEALGDFVKVLGVKV